MDSSEAASWLRDHAGPGIKVGQITRGTQDVMLLVLSQGWPDQDPVQNGQVIFSLRRYDANGRQDDRAAATGRSTSSKPTELAQDRGSSPRRSLARSVRQPLRL